MNNAAEIARPFFTVRITGETLVVSFARRCDVVSWAPFHGGFRTDVSHVLVHRLSSIEDQASPERRLRQAAGRAGLKGTLVAMGTTKDLTHYCKGNAECDDLSVCTISVSNHGSILTPGDTRAHDASALSGSTCLLLLSNRYLSHEAMLEAMSVATETKVRVIEQQEGRRANIGQRLAANRMDCVAVAALSRQYSHYGGGRKCLVQLIATACAECLSSSLKTRAF